MTLPTRSAVAFLLALASFGPLRAQDSKGKPQSDEDAKLNRIIERWLDQNESEREHVLREVSRGNNGKVDDDFKQWFTRLGGDDDGWDRTRIQRGAVREIFDRIAQRIGVTGPILTRAQVVAYGEQAWGKEKSPAWRSNPKFDTGAECVKLFKHLDHDKDGYLGEAEMSPALRADLKRWDTDRDGWISYAEYRAYFAHRLDQVFREWQQRSEKTLPELPITAPVDEEKPNVMRAARLPAGLPAWFSQLDRDGDGQIGLYEWREAGWPLDEFAQLDANDDGFLEPCEVLKALEVTDREGARPFAYLLQKRIGKSTGATKLSSPR